MKTNRGVRHFALMMAIVLVYWWAIQGTNTSPEEFIKGIPFMVEFALRMFPPDFEILNLLVRGAEETLQIAVMGTTLGAIIAFPLSFLAARNVMPNRLIYHSTRTVFDICRGINEIVWALIFVSMVGLGAFPGVLALAVHLTGALGRYFSESIETVNPEVLKAIVATGANKIQIIVYGIIPEIKPLFINYVLYYFEHSVRAATILGLVGAGGIGMELITSMRLFKTHEVLTILIVMVLMVISIDRTSAYIRNKIVRVEMFE